MQTAKGIKDRCKFNAIQYKLNEDPILLKRSKRKKIHNEQRMSNGNIEKSVLMRRKV